MKLIAASILMFATSAFASNAQGAAPIHTTCLLTDMAAENVLITKTVLDLNIGDRIEIAKYNGHIYFVSAYDSRGIDGQPRVQMILGASDAATQAIVGASYAFFSKEIPDMTYQDGKNILFDCMQLN